MADISFSQRLIYIAAYCLPPVFTSNKWCRKSTANHSFTSFGSCRQSHVSPHISFHVHRFVLGKPSDEHDNFAQTNLLYFCWHSKKSQLWHFDLSENKVPTLQSFIIICTIKIIILESPNISRQIHLYHIVGGVYPATCVYPLDIGRV